MIRYLLELDLENAEAWLAIAMAVAVIFGIWIENKRANNDARKVDAETEARLRVLELLVIKGSDDDEVSGERGSADDGAGEDDGED